MDAAPPDPATASAVVPPLTTESSSPPPPPLKVPLQEAELSGQRLRVCVTGGTGYIAGHIVQRLLAAGHSVNATCRRPEDKSTWAHLAALPGAADGGLTVFKADLLQEGSFDDAVRNCDAVVHTASPFVVKVPKGQERETLIVPAVQGTANLLGAVDKAPSVKTVVVTSSTAAVFTDPHERGADHVFDEADWNQTVDEQQLAYFMAKREAERVAHKAAQKAGGRWRLCTICPGAVWGPPLARRSDSESVQHMRKLLSGRTWLLGPPLGSGFVDVRDVALAHSLALVLPAAQGRYLVNALSCYPMMFASQVLEKAYPGRYWLPTIKANRFVCWAIGPWRGLPHAYTRTMHGRLPAISVARAAQELGMTAYIPPDQTVLDFAEALFDLRLARRR